VRRTDRSQRHLAPLSVANTSTRDLEETPSPPTLRYINIAADGNRDLTAACGADPSFGAGDFTPNIRADQASDADP
jgi:hypothetical protein